MDRKQKIAYIELLEEKQRRAEHRKLSSYYPDAGPLRRELYKPHMAFFVAGADHRERAMVAANRVGKTEGVGGYELSLHLTGRYPKWWKGKRFNRPVKAWAAGSTGQAVREILQEKLLGPINAVGTGLIPGEYIADTKRKGGNVPDAIESVSVKHITGKNSRLIFKSYDQKRKAFEGTEQDVIWLDEEPDIGIYTECTIRTMTTHGIVMLTLTPLQGLSEVILQFLPGGKPPEEASQRFVVNATWDDAPHLSKHDRDELWASVPVYQRDARAKGIPQLGSGAIYPIGEEEVLVPDFEFPDYWPRVYGMDVGWNWTAAVWVAHDRENDIAYLYSGYKQGQEKPPVHVNAINARGSWIPGVIDPASQGSSQRDGEKLVTEYRDLGLNLSFAENAVEAGIHAVWLRLATGRLKIFKSCAQWFEEFRLYRRDEKGKVVKINDHLMDATRYLIMSGIQRAELMPVETYAARMYTDEDQSYDILRHGM